MKSCSKQKLADELGVSRQTFYRWLKRDQEVLQGMGVSIRAKILPPPAVRYICEKYNMHPPDWFVFLGDNDYICRVKIKMKLTKTVDVFPIADLLRPTEDGTAQEPRQWQNRRDFLGVVWYEIRMIWTVRY